MVVSGNLHVAQILFSYEKVDSPDELIDGFFTLNAWTEALVNNGIQITTFIRFHQNADFLKNGVRYILIKDNLSPRIKTKNLAINYNRKVKKILDEIKPDLIHAHNLFNIFPNRILQIFNSNIPYLVQDHSGAYRDKFYWLHKLFFKKNHVVFSSKGQEKPWVEKGILNANQCHFVMEFSPDFKHENRNVARFKTKMSGSPVFLWVGNLDNNKDPITVLKAFEAFLKVKPMAQLYMIYRFNRLGEQVADFIKERKTLKDSVHLLGPKQRNDLPDFYNSADFYISASYKEGSGYALLEAMACGSIPIVSNIPSFQDLTQNGNIGCLWEAGNADDLLGKMTAITRKSIDPQSKKVLQVFNESFSMQRLTEQMIEVYQKVISTYKKA